MTSQIKNELNWDTRGKLNATIRAKLFGILRNVCVRLSSSKFSTSSTGKVTEDYETKAELQKAEVTEFLARKAFLIQ
ncbi:MAG: hypothetical protein OEY22_00410 [Candidatus Bathyarchaeota archaeon]|nr:hypothetical protein [Candidatus Bathyarchaeota archaeon]